MGSGVSVARRFASSVEGAKIRSSTRRRSHRHADRAARPPEAHESCGSGAGCRRSSGTGPRSSPRTCCPAASRRGPGRPRCSGSPRSTAARPATRSTAGVAREMGLRLDDLSPVEAAAHAFGQRLAVSGPYEAQPPVGMSGRHRRELMAVSILMELANLAGNRFLAPRDAAQGLQVGDLRTARLLDAGMRAADRLGLRHARSRVVGGARGDILEIGIGTGSNVGIYPAGAAVHGLDVSAAALSLAAGRAGRSARRVTLVEGDAAALPFDDASFDTVVGTFVLCSVGDVGRSLSEARRVLRPGGTIRLLEHARARHPAIGALQERSAPALGPGQRRLPPRSRRSAGRSGRRSRGDRGTAAGRRAPGGDRRRLTARAPGRARGDS